MKRANWRSRGRDRHRQYHQSDWRRSDRSTHNNDQEYSSGSTADTGASSDSASSAGASTPAPELPGFYFDPEKNRYFRLLPGHNNCNPLTKEGLQKKEEEKRRSALLAEDDGPKKKAPRTGLNSALLLQKRHLGLLPPSSYCRLIHEVKVSGMQRHKLEVQSANSSSPNTDNFHLIVADSACERVFTVNDVSHGGCKYGIMNFHGCRKGSLSVEMCDNLYFTNRKVNSVCWASVTHTDSHVLLCLVGISQTPGCVSLLPASLFSNFNPDQPGMLCSFKISTAWSCAWCLNPQADKTFSTGLSRRVIVTDAVTGRRATYVAGSDVLAQQFALRAPVLFNGCRSGEIFSIDLRQRDRGRSHSWKTSRFFQESAITSLQLLQDENYLLAADMLGKIKLWDIRVKRSVKQYEGHHNEYAYLPIHVNEPEGLLLAVGQDCYTRLWSLSDGHLLRTIPSPHPAEKDSIPNVVFSSQLGGCRGLPGLLMAVRHDLYYYSYNKDYQDGLAVEGQC
ncbi:DDB1- and CUL4-associated factor 4-like isoform X1 [Myxocyprinus asiaticus]|uniref:DDB1- and CUL4-associated factor 4-like isoform X1 n=2 Tax=Myxocyprinus asiaticus TaxID=70543 RepID=UPI0022222D0C|nr:DDB1- and CUL4-associated factor 4-like isoform X1 [Myxocyprinus asiaticus]